MVNEAPAELAVVMPAYNEEEELRRVLPQWLEVLENLRVDYVLHVYDDGSTDGTLQVLQSAAASRPRLAVHTVPHGGHGPAILRAYRDNAQIPWIFQADSDGEIPPRYFPQLWDHRHRADFVVGRRLHRREPLPRRTVSRLAFLLTRALFGPGTIQDVNIPFRLLRTAAFRAAFALIPEGTFAPNVLLSGYAAHRRLRIVQVDITEYQPRPRPVTASLRSWRILPTALRAGWQTVLFRLRLARRPS